MPQSPRSIDRKIGLVALLLLGLAVLLGLTECSAGMAAQLTAPRDSALAQEPQPRGPEPDLPAGNGEIYGTVSGIRPSDGQPVMCRPWRIKLTAIKLGVSWACYDLPALLACEQVTITGVANPACRPYASGIVTTNEERGAIAGALSIVGDELWMVYTSDKADGSGVTAQEEHQKRLGVQVRGITTITVERRADLSPVFSQAGR